MIGYFCARAILDDRLISLPLSPVMWDLLLKRNFNIHSLSELDKDKGKVLMQV